MFLCFAILTSSIAKNMHFPKYYQPAHSSVMIEQLLKYLGDSSNQGASFSKEAICRECEYVYIMIACEVDNWVATLLHNNNEERIPTEWTLWDSYKLSLITCFNR